MKAMDIHRSCNKEKVVRAAIRTQEVAVTSLLCAFFALTAIAADLHRPIFTAPRSVVVSVQDYRDATLIDVLGQLSSTCEEQSGKKLQICIPIEYLIDIYFVRVTFRAIDVTLGETLEKLTQLSHLQFELQGETVNVRMNPTKERRLPEKVY